MVDNKYLNYFLLSHFDKKIQFNSRNQEINFYHDIF